MSVTAAIMVPHPPLIVPAVGRGDEKKIPSTTDAYRKAAAFLHSTEPDTVVIISPHAPAYLDYIHISPGAEAYGDFGRFGAGRVRFRVRYDTELRDRICNLADAEDFPAGTQGNGDPALDHGTCIPLYFLREAWGDAPLPPVLRIGLSGLGYPEHYRLGMLIRDAAEQTGRKIAVVGSGDLSHRQLASGPYGYVPEGPEYDRRIMDTMGRGAFNELFDYRPGFCDKAGECGHRSFLIMAGTLDGTAVEARALSHEATFGVGYGICTYRPVGPDPSRRFLDAVRQRAAEENSARRAGEDPWVHLARTTIEGYTRTGEIPQLPEGLPDEMTGRRAGVFVSIHENGQLRGCIGTISATAPSVAAEIRRNAVSACSEDPRFPPVRADELDALEISVDVLGPAETIASAADLDPKRYGVIVSSGWRRGLLLPDLEGVDTPDEQIRIAKRKAGIDEDENVTLQRFEVIRHV